MSSAEHDRAVLDELTPAQKSRLIRHAARTTRRHGYCDEVVHIMNAMLGAQEIPVFGSNADVDAYVHPHEKEKKA